jgi:hypothetical protein
MRTHASKRKEEEAKHRGTARREQGTCACMNTCVHVQTPRVAVSSCGLLFLLLHAPPDEGSQQPRMYLSLSPLSSLLSPLSSLSSPLSPLLSLPFSLSSLLFCLSPLLSLSPPSLLSLADARAHTHNSQARPSCRFWASSSAWTCPSSPRPPSAGPSSRASSPSPPAPSSTTTAPSPPWPRRPRRRHDPSGPPPRATRRRRGSDPAAEGF